VTVEEPSSGKRYDGDDQDEEQLFGHK
jgi:hypothetical protein